MIERTPVEWVSIGAGTLVLAGIVFVGLIFTVVGIYMVNDLGLENWRLLLIGPFILAIPVVLYGIGRVTNRAWLRIGHLRP
jgi:hypothetical protein